MRAVQQITLMRLHQSVAADEGKGQPAASYIWRTAYTVMIDEIRRRARRPEAPLDQALEVVRADPSPEDRAAGKQLGLAIRECLAAVVPTRRAAAVLHLQGHTVPEVARLMQWDEKKAENLVYRALADLRACLTSKGLKP